nr:hypothetical protein TDPV-089 [Oriental turtle dovepox virus]
MIILTLEIVLRHYYVFYLEWILLNKSKSIFTARKISVLILNNYQRLLDFFTHGD